MAESYAAILDTENTIAPEVRKWRANLVANYRFARASMLKGFSIGTGIRWEDKATIGNMAGYRPIAPGAAAGTLPAVYTDPNRAITSKATTFVDGWLGYQRRIYKDKIDRSVRLSGRNLFCDDTPLVIKALGNGQAGLTRIPPEQRFFVTNTFEFQFEDGGRRPVAAFSLLAEKAVLATGSNRATTRSARSSCRIIERSRSETPRMQTGTPRCCPRAS